MRSKSILFIIVLIIIVQGLCYSFGQKEKPVITVNTVGPQYLSPNGDGVQDTASFTFTVVIKEKSKEGYVPKYGIKISDSTGNIVVENVNKEKSDVNFFSALFMGYKEFTLDKEVTWDGKNSDGTVLPDGTYDSTLWVKDSSGNLTEEPLEQFILDTGAPKVTINLEYQYFSPNGDGNQDNLVITHSGTLEAEWVGTILDSTGAVMKKETWTNAEPGEIVWDGMLPDGNRAPDGTYSYTIKGTDVSGNSSTTSLDTIVLDTRDTPIMISLSSSYFSPNGDGRQDDVTIIPAIEDQNGLLSWKVSVTDMDGNSKRNFSGPVADVQKEILFDGKDDSGIYLPEGEYQVAFEVKYNQGNNPVVTTLLSADLQIPDYNVIIENPYFSPNGDGYGDILLITIDANEEISVNGDILNSDGTRIRNVSADAPAKEIPWDGMDNEGTIQPESMYTLSLYISDRAGNWAMYSGGEMYIDFTPPEAYISLSTTLFSPNGDGQKDFVGIEINSNEPVLGNCVVKDRDGNDVQYVSVLQDMTRVEWDGNSRSGQVVPDGTYLIEGVLSDLAGNSALTESHSVSTDTRSTKVSLTVPRGFSPNGDAVNDILNLGIAAELKEGIIGWNLVIEKTPGVPSKTYSGGDTLPEALVWDGIDQMNQIQEGTYTAKLTVEYQKGDISEGISNRFKLDVSPPSIALDVKQGTLEGEEDPLSEEVFITMKIEDESEIETWNLDIVNNEGDIIRSYGGEGDPSDDIAWNASGKNEKPVPAEDLYTIVVEVTDVEGNRNTYKQTLPLDLLIARIGDKYYLIVPNIVFGAYQYTLNSAGAAKYKRNLASLKKAAEIYKKFPMYKVGLEAYALNIFLNKGEKAKQKEEKRLVPLTKNRANTVKNALIKEGIDKNRIEMKWFGGANPIVSVEDKKVYWKNRRVEFLLIKPETEETTPEE
ncbi:MAG: gliding motility-associated C-terminal domain-containing protein [Spirochaetales bacterium]|nr:gliding motility-associated C-terminal domain-containing protein [Spirochaetales bacterium]